jgi:shikimate kinase
MRPRDHAVFINQVIPVHINEIDQSALDTRDLLWQRVRHKGTRPLLRTADPRATLAALLAERAPVYALADITVEVRPGHSIDETTARVLDALAAWPGLMERA